jgi:hypothetical protein
MSGRRRRPTIDDLADGLPAGRRRGRDPLSNENSKTTEPKLALFRG